LTDFVAYTHTMSEGSVGLSGCRVNPGTVRSRYTAGNSTGDDPASAELLPVSSEQKVTEGRLFGGIVESQDLAEYYGLAALTLNARQYGLAAGAPAPLPT
jgi:hypothetical protein